MNPIEVEVELRCRVYSRSCLVLAAELEHALTHLPVAPETYEEAVTAAQGLRALTDDLLQLLERHGSGPKPAAHLDA